MIKKLLFLLIFLFISITSSQAQSFTLGFTGQGKNTWLVNQPVMKASREQEFGASAGWGAGAHACLYFNQHSGQNSGVAAEVLYGTHSQNYSGLVGSTYPQPGTIPFDSKIKLSALDIPLYARLGTKSGAYFEIGAQFSLVMKAEFKFNPDSAITVPSDVTGDVTNKFSNSYIAPLLGFGVDIPVADDWYIHTGLRFVYALTDLIGVDGKGRNLNDPSIYPNPYAEKGKTHAGSAIFNLGVHYRFDVGKYGRVR